MIYVIYIIIIFFPFLLIYNDFLRGSKKIQIDAFLGMVIMGLIISSFFVAGWKYGLVAVGLVFVSAIVTRPIAARLASKTFAFMMNRKFSNYPGLPPKSLERISMELGNMQLYNYNLYIYNHAKEALINYCIKNTEVLKVMNEHQISREDLLEIYDKLIAVGAGQWRCGHWIPASVLAYPETLRYILVATKSGQRREKTAYNLMMYFDMGEPLSFETLNNDLSSKSD